MMMGTWAETITAVTGLITAAGVALRYVVRIAATIERTAKLSADTAAALHHHVEESDRFHGTLTDRLGEHAARLAVVESHQP